MEQYIFDKSNGLWYQLCEDYYIPCLTSGGDNDHDIGIYGRRHKQYLEEHHPSLYARLLLSGKLWEHLAEIDRTCNERMERLIPAMAKREGVTEALKASNQLEWVGRMNSIRNRAEEIVLSELVYSI